MIHYNAFLTVVGIVVGFNRVPQKKRDKLLVRESVCISPGKIRPEVYKGISYIRLSNLPNDQRQVIAETRIRKIKIKTESSILHDCVQYHDYENWYESNVINS
jgi:hypothetical protein